MSFSLKILNEPIPKEWKYDEEQGYLVEVKINDFVEKTTLLTDYWSKEDYIKQWIHSVNVLTGDDKRARVAFTTAVHNPKDLQHGYVVQWWTDYRENNDVFIRNSAVQNKDGFDLSNLYNYVPERDLNGAVSEWKVSVDDIVEFGSYLKNSFR